MTAAAQAAAFYTRQAGYTLDVGYHPALGSRAVQVTPPGAACSVQISTGLTDAGDGRAGRRWIMNPADWRVIRPRSRDPAAAA